MTVWRFPAHRADEKIRNPIQGEFFSEEAVERPAQALVREVIQNSLDARASDAPVEVRFALSAPDAMPADTARHWLGGAWPHLRAEGSGLRSVPAEPRPGRTLVIEDFGTSGLTGDPLELRPTGAPSRLFAFFRAEGISQKGGKDGGRWGVGKTVFLRSSELNTILCLTSRGDDGSRLVFGQSVLRYHWLDGTYFTPDGAFGAGGREAVVPSRDPALAERLVRDFGLARRDEPGLSVVIPYASEELTGSAVLDAVMREYFYPILTGRLVVTVDDPALPSGPRQLTADTLVEELVKKPDLNASVGPLSSLTLWLAREGLGRAVRLNAPAAGTPEWSGAMLPAPLRDHLTAEFRQGREVLFEVPLTVQPIGEEPKETSFHVLLRRDLADRGAAPAFVRNGIQIPKALERRVRGQSLWALVIIEDQPIATLLGDAETPAHTHWSKDTQNFRKKYRYGAATIDFVRQAPRQLAEALTEPARERDFLSLVQFFPMPRPGPARAAPAARPAHDEEAAGGSQPEVRPAGEAYRVERLEGGFRISPGPSAGTGAFHVAVAYDCTRGHPLRRWHSHDFDVADLPVHAEGLTLVRRAGREIVARPQGRRFRLEVTGFDPNRDLFLRVTPAEEESA